MSFPLPRLPSPATLFPFTTPFRYRQTNIASKYFGSIDPFGAGFGQANIGVGLSAANTQRYDNMVMYQTPSYSGFQFGVGYSFNADDTDTAERSEEHTSELQSLIRISYVVFCLKKKNIHEKTK